MAYPQSELSNYLATIRRIPHLEASEELELARRFHDHGDLDARDTLVQSHLGLVYQVVRKYPSRQLSVLEQLQEGNIGLLHAAEKFDPERGIRFAAYARYWVRAYVLQQLMSNFRLVRIGTSVRQRKMFFQLRKVRKALEDEGLKPTPERLAERLEVPVEEVLAMETRLGHNAELSLDFQPDGERSFAERIADDHPDIEALTAHKELRDRLSRSIETFRAQLDSRELDIWELRMLNDEPTSLRKLGSRLGISRERVRQIESGILARLRDHFSTTPGLAYA